MKIPILLCLSGASLVLVGAGGIYLGQPSAPQVHSAPDQVVAPARAVPFSLQASTAVPAPVVSDRYSPPPVPANRSAPAWVAPAAPAVVPSGIPSGKIAVTAAIPAQVPAALATDGGTALGEPRAVNPAAVGNSFAFRGVRVAVAEAYPAAGAGGTPLGIDVTPEIAGEVTPAGSADSSPGALAASADPRPPRGEGKVVSDPKAKDPSPIAEAPPDEAPAVDPPSKPETWLAKEDQYFRMKWGWAAYDAAKREAAREAGNLAVP